MSDSKIIVISHEEHRKELKNILDDYLKPFYDELKKINEPEELLTRAEVKALLKISDTTLWHWERKGIIQGFGIEGKKFFKRTQVMAALIKIS